MSSSDHTCRFLYENLVEDETAIQVSSARAGLVGLPAPQAAGSAAAYSAGSHTGAMDQLFVVEIDGLGGDGAVGNATFRWRRSDAASWEASGVATSSSLVELADGVKIKWVGGPGQDFQVGDRWTILATRPNGGAALADGDRDTVWEAEGCARESIVLELAEPQAATALVLGDHNLTAGATATLEAGLCLDLDFASGSCTDQVSFAEVACERNDPVWGLKDGLLTEIPAHTPALVDDPAGGDGRALMASPPSANLIPYSADMRQADWTKTRCTLSASPVEAPDGSITAYGLASTASGTNCYAYPAHKGDFPCLPGEVWTFSFFAKAGSKAWAAPQVNFYDAAGTQHGYQRAWLEITETDCNGWQRCVFTFTIPSTTPAVACMLPILVPAEAYNDDIFTGDGSVSVYFWGMQLERKHAATAYMPTSGIAADVMTEANDFSAAPWYRVRCALSAPVVGPSGGDAYGVIADIQTNTHFISYEPSPKIAVSKGQRWAITAYAMRGDKSLLRCSAWFYDADGGYLGAVSSPALTIPDTGAWAKMSFAFDVPAYTAGAADMTFGLFVLDAGEVQSWAGDAVTVSVYLAEVTAAPSPASRCGERLYLPASSGVQAALASGGSGTLRAETIFGFAPAAGAAQAGLVSSRSWFSSLLYYDPSGSIMTRDSTTTAAAALSWTAGTAHELAARWGSGGQMQAGAGASWGTAAAYDGDYSVDSPAYVNLAMDLALGPLYFRRLRLWEHWDAAATPAAVGDAYTDTLTIMSPHLAHFMDRTARIWRVTLADPHNPAGLLTASLLYLGGHFQPSRGLGLTTSSYTLAAARTVNTTDSGVITGSVQGLARQLSFKLRGLTQADVDALEAMQAAVHQTASGRLRPIFFLPLGATRPDWVLYCLPPASLTHRQESALRHAVELTLSEVAASHV